ncbi:MAG TPA: DPP IV N-terminal domain-containing protein, partial [Steroidobacter sp.]
MRNVSKALVALALAVSASTPAAAITREDYVQAEALSSGSIGKLVLNERVVPHWLPGRDEFWYRRETASGHEFVLVDAASGRKRSVNKDYVCKIEPAECPDTAKASPGILVSPDGRSAAFTRDGNLWLRDLTNDQERALTDDGEKNFGYGITPDGWKAAFVPRLRSGVSPPPLESYWSPDSKRLIVSRVDQRHVTEYPFLESVPADGSFRPKVHPVRIPLVGERPATLEWFVFDVSSGGPQSPYGSNRTSLQSAAGAHRRIEYPYDQLLVLQQDLLAIRKTWWSPDNQRLYAV